MIEGFLVMLYFLCFSLCDLQLHDEYELDKQQAMDRIASEVQQSITNMRNCIERTCEQQRDELMQRLELEQKERLAVLKRYQWVCIILLFIYSLAGDNLLVQHTHACTHTHNRFTAVLDFVQDYSGEPAPER